jgi:peptidyl-prolyl cis-trans isomerase D
MPFAVFRRHQRKLLAVFAILAMFGFVVADSLPRLLSGNSAGGGNPVVVELYGKPVRQSDLVQMRAQRNSANLFMGELTGMSQMGRGVQNFFGDLSTRSIVDALILEHEATRLGMPVGPEVGREWLKKATDGRLTRDIFEALLSRFNNRISGEQLLTDIANQVRISNVRNLLGAPVVTPLEVFQTYRDQNERVSVRAVGFPVAEFINKVREPSDAEVKAFYEKYKKDLPDPNRPTPGFTVPRQVKVEILSIDGQALAASMKEKLTETELKTYYENRKAEFKKPSEFPEQVFADDPENKLTPPQTQTFDEVRPYIATSLADEKAQAEIVDRFERIKNDHMIPFVDKVLEQLDEAADAAKAGRKAEVKTPEAPSLKPVAEKEGLQYEVTKLLTREAADRLGLISGAEVGLTRLSGGRKFAEEMFDAKSTQFEPIELTDFTGHRFLVRKLEDVAPHVPALDQIRPEVVLAWKLDQARPLAEKAAEALAEKLKKEGGKIVGDVAEGHPVVNTDPVSKLQPGQPFLGRLLENGPPTPAEIPQIPAAGQALRDAYFGLGEKEVAVAPDQPKNVYYVMTLNRRIPATFATLYAPNGDYFRYRNEAITEAYKSREDSWMKQLRAQAGVKDDWVPSDESKSG